jgi:hypothetical protein
MQRIVRGHSATLTHTFYVDGVATDPSPATATVTITTDDGTVLVAAGAATRTAAGVFTYTLTPSQTATLDILTVAWTATMGGQSQAFTDTVEVAGGVLFTVAEARALSALSNTTTYPTAKIIDARTYVESELEQACGVAFVPRYARQSISGTGGTAIMLPPRVTAIRSVTLDDTAISAGDLAALKVRRTGEVYNPAGWASGWDNYEIAYEHGYSDGPERMAAREAALTYAKHFLVKGPIDDRTTSFSTEDGTFSMSTPGVRGAITGIPAVDSFIQRYSLNVAVA